MAGQTFARATAAVFLLLGALLGPGSLLSPREGDAQVLADYTSTPPFISDVVTPNVLLLLDNSGSMDTLAYQTDFDPNTTFFGLFDPFECYDYSSNAFIPDPAANPSSLGTCVNSPYLWSGNLLNWGTMRRIDIVKWVMMGGICSVGGRDAQGNCRQVIGQSNFGSSCCVDQTHSTTPALAAGRMPVSLIPPGASERVNFHLMGSINALKGSFCLDDDHNPPTGSSCDDEGSYPETKWQIRVDHLENTSGVIQQVGSKARFGLMEFKGVGDGGKVLTDVGGNLTSMITAIESTTPSTWTPLAESLYEATRYFAQIPPAYTNSDYSYNVTNRDPYYFTQPTWASTSQYVKCCKSFVIVFTDGEPTQDLNIPAGLQDQAHALHGAHCVGGTSADTCTPHKTNYPSNGSHYLDDVAYWAHTTDLRQTTLPVLNEAGKNLDGVQNLIIYTFYAFGQPIGREILQSTAKFGGFEDSNGNKIPDLTGEWDKVNNYSGVAGADGLPDTYFESQNAYELRDKLMATITSILQRSASGTSTSVLATSSTGEGALYQSYFFPSAFETSTLTDVKWTGYTQGLFLDSFGNMREDTDQNGRLVLKHDKIIVNRYDSAAQLVKVDKYVDLNEDGKADDLNGDHVVDTSDCSPCDEQLTDILPIWEAGKQLALLDQSARNLLTWVDSNNNGVVDSGEQIAFTTANATTLAPYLRAAPGLYSAANIIDFIRGVDPQVTGMRDRRLLVPPKSGTLKVWKLGDSLHSTPVVVGAPMERYDLLYGDSSYTAFLTKYKNRRLVAYVGANDGMLHAFNAGFYHRGDDPSTPAASKVEHGWFTRTVTDNSSGPLLGDELWGFIPHQLLPHLQWLAREDYIHTYYVDLKPKVTDARIFTPDADHPNGWGTILIGGMRLGGSCGAPNPGCQPSTGAPPMTVTADFGSGIQTRTFYSAYFVLDVTNPEVSPRLLMSFADASLGLSTSYPAVVRVNPFGNPKTSNTNAKWIMAVGSGPTSYDSRSAQIGKVFAIDLASGPGPANVNVTTFPTSGANSTMGDLISVDVDLDYRADVLYSGNSIDDGSSPWTGKLYRLTTGTVAPFGGATTLSSWGYSQAPTVLLGSVTGGPTVGPITAAPTVAADEASKVWVFWGTGRYFGTADKTDSHTQHLFGVKDTVVTGACTQTGVASCEEGALVNVSAATVCVVGTGDCGQAPGTNQVTGVTGVTGALNFSGSSTSTLEGLVQSMDGWFTTLPDLRERSVVSPTLLGGMVFFPTFVPVEDLCVASGSSSLYALFYKTGTAYKQSVIGTSPSGSNSIINRRLALSSGGLSSQMAVHIGAQGSGNFGTGEGSGTGVGCAGHVTGFIQSSTGNLGQVCSKLPGEVWSHFISWINLRL